jgi:hypothetical protein
VYLSEKRFPGPAVKVVYQQELSYYAEPWYNPQMSNPLKVVCCTLDDLPLWERKAMEAGRQVNLLDRFAYHSPPGDLEFPLLFVRSGAISLPPSDFVPNQPRAFLSWDDGKEVGHPNHRQWGFLILNRTDANLLS